MASPDLATLYCRFVDSVVNRRRLDHLDQYLARDVIEHAPARTVGLEASRRRLARWLATIPDAHLLIEDLVVEGDHLMARLRATGTHREPVGGEPAGARLSVLMDEAWTIRDGWCVEHWLHADRSALASAARPASRRGGTMGSAG